MLTIRDEQMEAFHRDAVRKFEDAMLPHLSEHFPRYVRWLGEEGCREAIRHGVREGKRYGLTYRQPSRIYIDMMFLFGGNFDRDPQLSWAAATLNDETIANEFERADRLYDRGMEYLRRTAGSNRNYPYAALQRGVESVPDPPAGPGYENYMMEWMAAIFPEKYWAIGDDTLRAIIVSGRERAAEYALESDRDAAIYTTLMFLFGAGFDADPLFPWASELLAASAQGDLAGASRLLEHAAGFVQQLSPEKTPRRPGIISDND